MTITTRHTANYAIDTYALGGNSKDWKHVFVDDKAVPYCDVNKKLICSPPMPPILNPLEDTLVRGKNEHEAGHARFTPSGKDPKWSALKGEIINRLEDLRIEKGLKGIASVFATDLDTMNNHFLGIHNEKFVSGEYKGIKPINEALMALHSSANGIAPRWTLSPMAQKYFDSGKDIFNQWEKADSNSTKGFKTILDIADKLLAKWEELKNEKNKDKSKDDTDESDEKDKPKSKPKPKKNKSKDDTDESDEKDDTDESDEKDKSKDDTDESDEKSKSKSKKNKSKDDTDESDEKSKSKDDTDDTDESDEKDKSKDDTDDTDNNGDEAHKKSDKANHDAKSMGKNRVEDDFDENDHTEENEIEKVFAKIKADAENNFGVYNPYREEDVTRIAERNKNGFDNAFNSIRGMPAKISAYLQNSLKTLSRARIMHDRDKGEIDVQRNASIIAKSLSKYICKKSVTGISLDTTISILVDESASIGRSISLEFQKLTVAFAEAFERLGMKFEILGHSTEGSHCPNMKAYSRCERLLIREYKAFNDKYSTVKYRLGSIGWRANNIDGEALLETYRRNMLQHSKRHVILVLSDGQPAAVGNITQLCQNLHDTVAFCRKNKAEVYAFGIGTKEPQLYYGEKNFVYVDGDCSSLTTEFFHKTANILINGKMN